MKLGPDSTLIAPHRGKPPVCPEGYIRDGDPFVFIPILPACSHRITKKVKSACCPGQGLRWCSLKECTRCNTLCLECVDYA